MPCLGFRTPDGQELSFAEGIKYFDEKGIIPAEVTSALAASLNDVRRGGFHLSPSKLNPDTTCRRQTFLERHYDYYMNPLVLWEAEEGTLFHEMVTERGKDVEGWRRELLLPSEADEGKPGVVRDERGVLHLEVAPGILLNGQLDRLSLDGKTLIDYKTTRYPWTPKPDASPRDFGPKSVPEWAIQVNAYRHLAEALGYSSGVEQMYVWRVYRGSRLREKTFARFDIPILPMDRWLSPDIQKHCITTRDWLMRAETEGADVVEPDVPLDGKDKRMFGDKKCTMYCSMMEVCFGKTGKVVF